MKFVAAASSLWILLASFVGTTLAGAEEVDSAEKRKGESVDPKCFKCVSGVTGLADFVLNSDDIKEVIDRYVLELCEVTGKYDECKTGLRQSWPMMARDIFGDEKTAALLCSHASACGDT